MPRNMTIATLASVLLLSATPGHAGPEKVLLPKDYTDPSKFVNYLQVERPDRNPPQIRFMYANKAAVDAARPNQPAPSGTVLIMEDRKAAVDASGKPQRDGNGRMVPTAEILAIAAQEKQPGWGAEYPIEKRNGEWEYNGFAANGTPRANLNTQACHTCHLNRTTTDYNFTFTKWVNDAKR
jgi:Cytochrome P460